MTRNRSHVIGIALAVALGTVAVDAAAPRVVKPVSVTLPAPLVPFKDGPNVEVARAYCLTCHSAEYVYMQPPLSRATWTAEVTKMRNTYGAAIPDSAIDGIVDYLVSQNGPTAH
jgi:sulfite dehydrogenase (cytochrome) subunit B